MNVAIVLKNLKIDRIVFTNPSKGYKILINKKVIIIKIMSKIIEYYKLFVLGKKKRREIYGKNNDDSRW